MGLLNSIPGLEQIFGTDRERKPDGYSMLIIGGSGRGKTTLAYQLMHNYLKGKKGAEFGLYITFEQSQKTMRKQMEALETFKSNPGIIIRDHLFLSDIFRKNADQIKADMEKLEADLESIKKGIKEKKSGVELILKIEDLQLGMETLTKNVERIPFGEDKKEANAEVEILKAHDIPLEIRKALILGRVESDIGQLKEKEKTVQQILTEFKKQLKEYSQLINATAFTYIEYAVEEGVAMVRDGKFPFIQKDAELGVVVIDSLQLVEADLEIGNNEDKIRKIVGRLVRRIMESQGGLNIIAILEAKNARSKEHPDTLPETYAFETSVQLKDKEKEDPNKLLFDFVVVKHRGPHKKRTWPYAIEKNKGIVFAPED